MLRAAQSLLMRSSAVLVYTRGIGIRNVSSMGMGFLRRQMPLFCLISRSSCDPSKQSTLLRLIINSSYSSISGKYMNFDDYCNETLESLAEHFDELENRCNSLPTDYDVTLSDGVLTVYFGQKIGTYVINKQTPNQQIWLSSPKSGPKRYDRSQDGGWVYSRDNRTLHELLNEEITNILGPVIDFNECFGSKISSH